MFYSKQFVFVMMDDQKRPPYFTLKKYLLSTLVLINIIGLIYYSVYMFQLTDRALHKIADLKPEQYVHTTNMVLCIMVALIGLVISLQLVFLVGIYKENECLTITYVILVSVATLLGVAKAFYDPYFWSNTIWLAVTAVMSLLYLFDLRIVQQAKNRDDFL